MKKWSNGMSKMKELLKIIAFTSDCVVHPARGLPVLSQGYPLLPELQEFYTLCGGITFYSSAGYSLNIVPPEEFVPANTKMFFEAAQTDLDKLAGDRSTFWHIIGKVEDFHYIVIDLEDKHLGRFYDCFWDNYAMPGYMPVVALSLYDLLNNLYANQGEYWFWLRSGFLSLGDAYD
jgi:antitoxin YokJ